MHLRRMVRHSTGVITMLAIVAARSSRGVGRLLVLLMEGDPLAWGILLGGLFLWGAWYWFTH